MPRLARSSGLAPIFVTTDGRVLGRIDRVTDEAGVLAKLDAL